MEVVVIVQLKEIDEQFVELRYRVAGSVEYQSRNLPSAEIAGLYDFIDSPFDSDNYYLPKLGRKLFDWLDGSQRWLSESILQGRGYANEQHSQGLIIAIDAQGRLGGLPWEILFDDKGFLVTRSIVPIRVVGGFAVGAIVNRVADRELRALFMATDPIDVYRNRRKTPSLCLRQATPTARGCRGGEMLIPSATRCDSEAGRRWRMDVWSGHPPSK
jgi:hypothetical protein